MYAQVPTATIYSIDNGQPFSLNALSTVMTTTTAASTTFTTTTTATTPRPRKRKKIRLTYDNLAPNLLIDGMLPPGKLLQGAGRGWINNNWMLHCPGCPAQLLCQFSQISMCLICQSRIWQTVEHQAKVKACTRSASPPSAEPNKLQVR